MKYNKALFGKYINLLGINPNEPSFEALNEIVKAHLTKVPFENISKLLFKKQGLQTIPALPQYLEGIEKYNFGGTCYSNNYYLFLLLKHLGYDVKLCGADMNNPDVHIVSIVKIDRHEFIVDVGYAAPFMQPLPRYLKKDYKFTFGYEKYVLKPQDKTGCSKIEQYVKGELKHGYKAKPIPRNINFFRNVIEDSYRDDATFMNAVVIVKFLKNGSVVLRNFSLIQTLDNKVTVKKLNPDDLPSVIENSFGIQKSIAVEAMSVLGELKDTRN